MHGKAWVQLNHPILNPNCTTVAVWEWISNSISYFITDTITLPCWDWSWNMLIKGVPDDVFKNSSRYIVKNRGTSNVNRGNYTSPWRSTPPTRRSFCIFDMYQFCWHSVTKGLTWVFPTRFRHCVCMYSYRISVWNAYCWSIAMLMISKILLNFILSSLPKRKNWHLKECIDYDDAVKWKHFPRYWPFVRGIHRASVDSPHKTSESKRWYFLWSAPEQTVE